MTLPQPLLVFGPRKSGTTLLHNMLDGGSELVMIPGELKLQLIRKRSQNMGQEASRSYLKKGRLDFERMMTWKNNRPFAHPDFAFDGLDAAQTRKVFDVENYVEQLATLLDTTKFDAATSTQIDSLHSIEHDVAAFLGAMKQRPANPQFWASKEISSWPDISLGFWRSLFPEGRIVFLVRQPEFNVRSILNDRRRKGLHLSLRMIWRHCAEVQRLINFASKMTQEDKKQRPIFIAYEDLTTDTKGEMRRIARELGIAFEPILARPTTLGVPIVVRTSSRSTTEVFRQETDWRTGLTPREIRAITFYQKFQKTLFRDRKEPHVSYETLCCRINELKS